MEIRPQAALSILSMTVQGAHDALDRAHAQAGAGAPASGHADVILQLSTAAQSLITPPRGVAFITGRARFAPQ